MQIQKKKTNRLCVCCSDSVFQLQFDKNLITVHLMQGRVFKIRSVLTCPQWNDANRRLPTDQFVADSFQHPQHPAHRPVAPTDQHPEAGNFPEGVEAAAQRRKTGDNPRLLGWSNQIP